MTIKTGSEVTLLYKLTYDNAEGELIEETTTEEPMSFSFGKGEMLDAFEEELAGKKGSEEFSFTLTPEQAYGEVQGELVVEYTKDSFLVEGELDEDFLQEGEWIEMTDDDENVFEGMIEENKVNTVLVNFNHPLAGESIHFKGLITKVS
ncbi:MAG: FKBP-type peptidyl-prolyl cis-trans isomerase SlyD [Flavobacteriales bacterium]|jgi:FKBP-type peptidyl-prolyl cis-trans isomerase SlyD